MPRLKVGLTAVAVVALISIAPHLLIAGDTQMSSNAAKVAATGAQPQATRTLTTDTVTAKTAAPVEHKLQAEPVQVPAAKVAELAPAPSQPAAVQMAAVTAAPVPSDTAPPAQPAAAAPDAAKLPPPKPETTLAIDIDLSRQQMTLTEHGKVVGSWPISSGREGFRSPTGSFHPLWMSKMWYSKKYDNAPMPNSVFFSGGVAMHATQAVGMLGRPASHGCIRQSPANSATTFKLVQKHGNAHTKIVVHGTPHDYEPRVARRDRPSEPRVAARDIHRSNGNVAMAAPAGTRRVILIDGSGNRRVADISANDPRLASYQRRAQPAPRARYAQQVGYSSNNW